ncbi:unnamed protein product, partial [Brenthis ino]
MERASSKQYEVINMLWRKTKIFIESDDKLNTNSILKSSTNKELYNKTSRRKNINSFSKNQSNKLLLTTHTTLNIRPSTPSYIEFYYLDDSVDRKNNKETIKSKRNQSVDYKISFLRQPFFLFRINDPTCRPTSPQNSFPSSFKPRNSSTKAIKHSVYKIGLAHKALPIVTVPDKSSPNMPLSNIEIIPPIILNKTLWKIATKQHTTPYDRIKFFEIYDSETFTPPLILQQNKRMINKDYVHEEQIDLDKSNNCCELNNSQYIRTDSNIKVRKVFDSDDRNKKSRKYGKGNTKRAKQTVLPKTSYISQPASWFDYPFIAVYVYEPEQVRCDCASISSHWLVGAATCLYRYHKNFREDTRSAFVAYCSNNWRSPGRIAYVLQSVIHPQFHPKNYTRRHLYNIGIIQVVNSMLNTCNGWKPISLMSHQFAADLGGTTVTAVGWGLDRYDTTYGITELSTHPLMLYKGLIYSDSCPGNIGYSKAKQLNEANVKNIYCLSLPPYVAEEDDPVHGSLLLMGGKLIALYSQEERRRGGEQSAQYTGIWHLIPWLNDVAREKDEPDSFDPEI